MVDLLIQRRIPQWGGVVGDRSWRDEWNGLELFGPSADAVLRHLVDHGFLESDGGMVFIGQQAEQRFGRRNFMDLTAVFLGAPEFTVLAGRDDLGSVDASLLTGEVSGERCLLLGGRSWRVVHVDWRRRRCQVEPADGAGTARWFSRGSAGSSFELTRAARDVLLGADPPIRLTRRAVDRLRQERSEQNGLVRPSGTVVVSGGGNDARWWTWAGLRANAVLATTLSDLIHPTRRFDDRQIRLRDDVTPAMWSALSAGADQRLRAPRPDEKALDGLKFSAALPRPLAVETLATRNADMPGAAAALATPVGFVIEDLT